MRRESHESSHFQQKLSLTSVLTPSFAKNNHGGLGFPTSDTPSGHSDFSFAIRDAGFSERSSSSKDGNPTHFSDDRNKISGNNLSVERTRRLSHKHRGISFNHSPI